MGYDFLGFLLVSAASLAVGLVLAQQSFNPFPVRLVLLAVCARIVGSLARYDLMRAFYGYIADAARYYQVGLEQARMVWSFDLTPFTLAFWFGGPGWWGTPFMEKISGVVLTVIGPTMRGEFLVFSMLAFFGLYGIALAAYRTFPDRSTVRYAALIWFWPSLVFWPSSTGKEAVILFAIGLCAAGYTSRPGWGRWPLYFAGLALGFAIRPHVAAALALATLIAYWVSTWQRLNVRRVIEATLAVIVVVVVLLGMTAQFGIEADLEGVVEFVEQRGANTLRGGSQIEGLPSGPMALPAAFVNSWMRPFPWEARNPMALFSALEVMALWALVAFRWRHLVATVRTWRQWRLLAMALPLLFGFTLMIGLTFGNLGIIARQRTPVLPFVLLAISIPPALLLRRRRPSAALPRRPARPRELAAPPLLGASPSPVQSGHVTQPRPLKGPA